MAMRISWYGAEHIAQLGRSRAALDVPLDAAIRRVFVPYCPGGRHGHRFWREKLSCGIVKSLFEASVQKAQNGPSTQLIEATKIKAEELTELSSYQMLRTDKNR